MAAVDAAAALRATPYDVGYWEQRYARSGAAFEWYIALQGADGAAGAAPAEAQLAEVRACLLLCSGPAPSSL